MSCFNLKKEVYMVQKVNKKYKIITEYASKKAIEKVQKSGGEIVLPK